MNRIIRIFAIGLAALASTQALASTCAVKEYNYLAAGAGSIAQAAQEPALVDQTAVDFTSGHAESAAFNALTTYIRVICDTQASFAVAAAPIAVTGNSWIPAGQIEYFGVKAGQKISFVAHP